MKVQSFTFNPFSENTYLLTDEENRCWIVDPGMYGLHETAALIEVIESEGLQPQAILNTHAHLDHIFGVRALQQRYNIPFAIHAAEVPVLAGASASAMMFGFQFTDVLIPSFLLDEKKALTLGKHTVQMLLAPGHSPGSVCFYHAAEGWIIAGDVLFAGSVGRADLPGGHYPTLLSSIQTQLLPLPDEVVVYPGHGTTTTIGTERSSNPFLVGPLTAF